MRFRSMPQESAMKHKSQRTIVVVPGTTPRNPFALAARRRLAGRHERSASGHRQKAERMLRAELGRMRHPTA
jgi:hypothetical protein